MAVLLMSLALMVVAAFIPTSDQAEWISQGKEAIKQCEKELPRHQECEVVITAEVKE